MAWASSWAAATSRANWPSSSLSSPRSTAIPAPSISTSVGTRGSSTSASSAAPPRLVTSVMQHLVQVEDRPGVDADQLQARRLVGPVEGELLALVPLDGGQVAMQEPRGQVDQVERALPRQHDVGRQSGVPGEPGQRPPAGGEGEHRTVGVVQDLAHRPVGEPLRQGGVVLRGQRVAGVDDQRVAQVGGQPERAHPSGPAAPDAAHGDGHRRARRRQPGRDLAGRRPPDRRRRRRRLTCQRVRRRGGIRQRLEEPVAQDPELQGVEDLVDLGSLERLALRVVQRDRQRDVRDQLGEHPVGLHLADVRAQRVADPALHLVGVPDELGERAVPGDPLDRGLLPHGRDRRQVVAGVAAQGGEVRVLRRGEPVAAP